MSSTDLSVIGLGKLGIPLAACMAAKGFRVTGVDTDPGRVEAVGRGVAPVFEPGLGELLRTAGERLAATQDAGRAVAASEATFIVVPTPSEPPGGFSLRLVLQACEAVGRGLRAKEGFHLVVLTSTVMPGSTGGPVLSALERTSGKICGTGFGLCYSPEFVALGSAVRDFLNPDFVLIGESDPRSGRMLEGIYKKVCDNDPPVARMDFVNAELTKLALNSFVTTKITFANLLARICERISGADVDVVTSALGLDSRIGRKYLKGAIGYGGPCFPRDNVALSSLARRLGVPATLAEATDDANRQQVSFLAELVKSKLPPGGTVGVLGLTYKPDTDVVEESQGLLLGRLLSREGIAVICYDPAGAEGARKELGRAARLASSVDECIGESDVVVIATPWEEFRCITPQALERRRVPRVVIDCWRLLDASGCRKVADYIALGIGVREHTARDDHASDGE